MPVTAAKLKQPLGELEPSLFPSGDIDTRLTAYIADGESRASGLSGDAVDLFVTAWAYYRAYSAIDLRLSTTPAEATLDSGASRYKFSDAQLSFIREKKEEWLEVADGFINAGGGSSIGVAQMKTPVPSCGLCRVYPCVHSGGLRCL